MLSIKAFSFTSIHWRSLSSGFLGLNFLIFIFTKCAGKISFDSIKEKIKQSTTTAPIALPKAEDGPSPNRNGTNTAIVVNTPKVAGIATRLTPRITLSVVWPCSSISSWALSPITMASSTTIPSTKMKANKLITLIVTSTNSIGITNKVPKKQTGNPIITQKAKRTRKNNANIKNTSMAPLCILSIIMFKR